MRLPALLSSLVACALLAACASAPTPLPPPAPSVQKVYVPVESKCAAEVPQAPRFAVDEVAIGAPAAEKFRMCYVEREQRLGYERALLSALRQCR